MRQLESAALLRIYTDQDALTGDHPLFEDIVRRARTAGLAGATVLQGRMGFGESAVVHEHHAFGLGDNLPVVIELVDEEAKLRDFVVTLEPVAGIGLITFEKVQVSRYGHQAGVR